MPETDVHSDKRLAQFDELVPRYPPFLRGQKGLSENTVRIYLDDLASFRKFMAEMGLEPLAMDRFMVRNYLAWLATVGKKDRGKKDRGGKTPSNKSLVMQKESAQKSRDE